MPRGESVRKSRLEREKGRGRGGRRAGREEGKEMEGRQNKKSMEVLDLSDQKEEREMEGLRWRG